MTNTPLVEAFTTLTDLTKTSEPMATFITREVNLYLDVLRVYGKRDKLSETDVHILCARLLDLAQIKPLASEAVPRAPSQELPIPIADALDKELSPVVKMYAPKKSKIAEATPTEASDEARL